MASLSSVFSRWKSHVSNNVHRQASYSFKPNDTPVHTLTSFYVVGDYENATECFITAHGGQFDDDYYFDNKSFDVPQDTTVIFYQPHGVTLSFSTNALRTRGGQPLSDPTATDLVYGAGDSCPNYILSKDQGHHLGNFTEEQIDGWKMTYEGAQEVCGELGVVMVIVRNRWFHTGVTLKSAIEAVQGLAPDIKTFKCLFCRVTDGSSGDWNARTGVRS